MKKKSRKKIWIIILFLAIAAAIAGMSFICWNLYMEYTAGQEYIIPTEQATEPATYGDTSDAPLDNVAPTGVIDDDYNGEINFKKLQEINPELYAWIRIPNTMIDYPIAQSSTDDSFYLEHNMYGEWAFAGCIYTEKCNSKDFSDPNTVLYGHNMLNGSMFRHLHNFRDEQFFADNRYIYIYTPTHTLTYEIFSAYEYDDRHIMNSFDFTDKEVFAEYLEYAKNPVNAMMANTRRDVNVTADDKIITLSTCLGDIDTSRYLVQGVLISDEPV